MKKDIVLNEDKLKEIAINAIKEKISDSLSYGSMSSIVQETIDENSDQIKSLIQESLSSIFGDKASREKIKDAFEHKVAKALVGKLEGAVERSVEKYRSDPALNAKLILAVESIIKEHDEQAVSQD